jgi:hypothetical protein
VNDDPLVPYRKKAAAPFSPRDIPGLDAWWSAEDPWLGEDARGRVGFMCDRSGNGHHLYLNPVSIKWRKPRRKPR